MPVEYDEMGCIIGTQTDKISNNVLLIPKYEAIVVGKEEKYGIVNSTGKTYIQPILDNVYSIITSGEEKFYMSFTIPVEEDGKKVEKQETYEVEQYFEQQIIKNTEETQTNQNNNVANTNEINNNQINTNEINNSTNVTNQ